jgi:hypothetical protein
MRHGPGGPGRGTPRAWKYPQTARRRLLGSSSGVVAPLATLTEVDATSRARRYRYGCTMWLCQERHTLNTRHRSDRYERDLRSGHSVRIASYSRKVPVKVSMAVLSLTPTTQKSP